MKIRMVILMCIVTFFYTTFADTVGFAFSQNTLKDIDSHWAEEKIRTLNLMGVMNGYNGYSNPDSKITRGEFTALITRAFGIKENKANSGFKDITKDHIFYSEINAAYNKGIIGGFPDGTFKADNMITREEIMLIISRLTKNKPSKKVSFDDIGYDYKYLEELSKVTGDGIINGYPDGSFRPYNNTTRSEAASVIVASLKKYMDKGNKEDLYDIANKYIGLYFSNVKKAEEYTQGSAKKDTKYILNTYETASKLGYTVINSALNINITDFSQDGPFSRVVCEYDVKRSINGNVKAYKASSDIYIFTINGESKVYSHNSRIIVPEFINLTWEVFPYSVPSYETPGVNVVSPTSFRIKQEPEDVSEKLDIKDENLYFNSKLGDEYLNYAKDNKYEIWAMYKTDFTPETASKLLNNDEARKQVNDILIKKILKHSLDGINFDFENMYMHDKGAYTNHVREVTLMAHTLGAVVSVDITKYEPTSSTWSLCYDRDALAEIADYIMLMAYDQYYVGSKTPGPVAGLGWTESCIKLTLNEVSPERLILGMPYYIRIWETKDNKVISSKAVSMESALDEIKSNSAIGEFDEKHGLTKYTWEKDESKFMLWLEDAKSIGERVALAKKHSLKGVASWRRGFETPDIWDAVNNEINR